MRTQWAQLRAAFLSWVKHENIDGQEKLICANTKGKPLQYCDMDREFNKHKVKMKRHQQKRTQSLHKVNLRLPLSSSWIDPKEN